MGIGEGVIFDTRETKKTALRLHHLDKAEHFVRTFIGITFVVGHFVVGCEILTPDHEMPDADERDPDEGPDEMFRFIKVMKP